MVFEDINLHPAEEGRRGEEGRQGNRSKSQTGRRKRRPDTGESPCARKKRGKKHVVLHLNGKGYSWSKRQVRYSLKEASRNKQQRRLWAQEDTLSGLRLGRGWESEDVMGCLAYSSTSLGIPGDGTPGLESKKNPRCWARLREYGLVRVCPGPNDAEGAERQKLEKKGETKRGLEGGWRRSGCRKTFCDGQSREK